MEKKIDIIPFIGGDRGGKYPALSRGFCPRREAPASGYAGNVPGGSHVSLDEPPLRNAVRPGTGFSESYTHDIDSHN